MPTAKKLPSGNWRVQVFVRTEKLPSGKNKNVMKSFTASTKDEAEFLAAEFVFKHKKKTKNSQNLTLGEAIDRYIESKENVLSPTTISNYKKIRKNHFQNYMNMSIQKIDNKMLQIAVNEEADRPVETNSEKKLSPKSISNAYSLVSSALKVYAPSVERTVRLPQAEIKIKELVEPKVIAEITKNTTIELPVLLAMWLGLSMSEMRGITKSKSINGDTLIIKDVVVLVDGKDVEKNKPKVRERVRALKIPEYIMKLIDKVDEDKIVTLSRKTIYYRFTALLKENGLPHMSIHDLRHVNASVMHLLRVPDKYAQERGGWKTPKVMKSVYTHTFEKQRIEVDKTIDAYFNEIIKSN